MRIAVRTVLRSNSGKRAWMALSMPSASGLQSRKVGDTSCRRRSTSRGSIPSALVGSEAGASLEVLDSIGVRSGVTVRRNHRINRQTVRRRLRQRVQDTRLTQFWHSYLNCDVRIATAHSPLLEKSLLLRTEQ